jgi:hypothetical protein
MKPSPAAGWMREMRTATGVLARRRARKRLVSRAPRVSRGASRRAMGGRVRVVIVCWTGSFSGRGA